MRPAASAIWSTCRPIRPRCGGQSDFIGLRDAWIYVHFHRVHDMRLLMAREERVRRDFEAWRERIEKGAGPVELSFG